MANPLVQELYEPHVLAARERVKNDPVLKQLGDPSINPDLLERFMIQYCAHGVKMTRPVEGWIRRAGEACIKAGLTEVGEKLSMHAKHEADHDKMFVEDVTNLVAHWNKRHPNQQLNATALLNEPAYPSTHAYIQLHEDVIASDMPAGQVAIELEIENLSLVMVGPLLANVERVCGREVLEMQTFLKEHNELDVGHTALNTKMMEKLLQLRREKAAELGAIGAKSLDTYLSFMRDCFEGAQAALKSAAA
jgi:hypothetical protein